MTVVRVKRPSKFYHSKFACPMRICDERKATAEVVAVCQMRKIYCSFSVAKLKSANTIAMIQNRIVTFVSGHPSS